MSWRCGGLTWWVIFAAMNTTYIPEDEGPFAAVLDCRTFASADEKYRALVAVTPVEELTDRITSAFYDGDLSKIESKIFVIDAADVPALYWAYVRYENLIGHASQFAEFSMQERHKYARFLGGGWSFMKAACFMRVACGLTERKCMAWVAKILAAKLRWHIGRESDDLLCF